ncbi:MAG TPA: cytochrome c3 family protein [Bacteroidales bacterium]|nr:cytochrome c3 family protein [Bacteroidales bacterium]
MNFNWLRFAVVLLVSGLAGGMNAAPYGHDKQAPAVQDTSKFISPYREDNERCLKCHGQEKYEYPNATQGRIVKALMCTQRIVRRDLFYQSNHKGFSCTDCHSESYLKFPHAGELRMEAKMNCIDCHGGDEKFAKYHFEEIEAEYKSSVHFKHEQDGFSCWKCHNPHTYKTSIRNTNDLKATILFSNSICLNCHANYDNFRLLTEREEINIVREHQWLPNQAVHFRSVRCIECHAKQNDSVLVSHEIRPKEMAVKKCNECHSRNSILMSSLYKFRSKELRQKNGFLNAVILNESYVIGANRNEYLNILSLVIFSVLVVVIIVHVVVRIRKTNKSKGGKDVSVS